MNILKTNNKWLQNVTVLCTGTRRDAIIQNIMEKNAFLCRLLDLFYPPRCVWCHCFLVEGEKRDGVCKSCRTSLPVFNRDERQKNLPGLDSCTSLLEYKGNVRQSILRYKFNGLSFYSSVYTDLMITRLDREEYVCDYVTWVPLSRKRLRNRGYDQAKLLSEEFATRAGLPCEELLKKVRNTAPQSGTGSRVERKSNIKDAYRTVQEEKIIGKTILLVDDIVTTGATLSECAQALKRAGANQVRALTLARTDLKSLELEKP